MSATQLRRGTQETEGCRWQLPQEHLPAARGDGLRESFVWQWCHGAPGSVAPHPVEYIHAQVICARAWGYPYLRDFCSNSWKLFGF